MITLELFEMKLMRTLKWLIAILIIQMKCRTSLMRSHEALSLGRSYPDNHKLDMYYVLHCVTLAVQTQNHQA